MSIEAVSVCIFSHVYVICVYVPPLPSSKSACRDEVLHFIVTSVDKITRANPKSEIVICGDFNRFPVNDLCNVCNLQCSFQGVTYNNSQLDYILMSEILSESYCVSLQSPIDNSKVPHASLLATPMVSQEEDYSQADFHHKILLDIRESYVKDFVASLQDADWSPVYRKDESLDTKAENFHQILFDSFSSAIPSYEVCLTPNDKPWMTPLIKHFWKTVKIISGKPVCDPVMNLSSH